MRRAGRAMSATALVVAVLLTGAGLGPASSAGAVASWKTVASPVVTNTTILYGVACTSATFCMAVGRTGAPLNVSITLIERWDGARWSRVASPSPGDATLSGVACTSATACTAVGYHTAGPLIERWNGRRWSVVASPYQVAGTRLSGVSCTSPTFCIAVGPGVGALIERWNGRSWSTAAMTPLAEIPQGRSSKFPTLVVGEG